MKGRANIYLVIFLGIITVLISTIVFLELKETTEFLISKQPESNHIQRLDRTQYLLILNGGALVLLLFISIRLAISRTKSAIQSVQQKDVRVDEPDSKTEEEKAQREESISRISESIVNKIEGNSVKSVAESYLIALSKEFEIAQGIFYFKEKESDVYALTASYAYYSDEDSVLSFKLGHGLPGQVAQSKEFLNLTNLPEKYLTIMSGLGKGSPKHLLIFPVVINGTAIGIVELASFVNFGKDEELIIKKTADRFTQHQVFVG